ncbi:venom carboxylesterase-6-like [Plodia interpunctella]|uniref:venom carboxylesterase-6-like n=1 Tax=Plodia interpunctella TaxID=58824 RepID=UPI0023675E8C|nr:venom carboxylesterase-6-like [Plodia interpunctella]
MDVKMNFLLPFFLLFPSILGNVRIDPLVDAPVGLIRGLRATDGDYSKFMGIPYAKINDNNPFGASIPITKFDGEFEAYNDAKTCPQYRFGQIIGVLDCLHLNVFVPNSANSQNKVPVMVWIHGGSFHKGTGGISENGPKYLVKHNVILVTINYRLGPYGFMCLDTPEIPGNQGLKDQLTALRWIKNNIESFGGDTNKITLFGVSAGGHSIDLHLLSNHDNLFNNIILQSGSSLATTVLIEHDKQAPIKLSEQLGYITDSLDDAITFLTQSDPNMVIAAVVATDIEFKPCAEQKFDDVESFINNDWINTNAIVPKIRNLPILTGFTSKEQASTLADKSSEYFANLNVIHKELAKIFNFNTEELTEMETYVRSFYLGDNGYSKEYKDEIGNFLSDHTYIHPIHRSIRRYLTNSAANVFLYMFSYVGGRNYEQNTFNDTIDGTVHGDELGYIFTKLNATEPSDADKDMIDKVTALWTNFAKYSDPTPEITDLLPVKWLPVESDQWYYLNIDSQLTLGSRPYHKRMAFWDLFYKLNGKKQKGYVAL